MDSKIEKLLQEAVTLLANQKHNREQFDVLQVKTHILSAKSMLNNAERTLDKVLQLLKAVEE